MGFLFVDRILELEPGKRAVGIKHVTPSDHYLTRGRSGAPALISAIIGETIGQLAAWNIMQANGFTKRPVAGVVHEVNILDEAYVGDTLLLEADIDSSDEAAINYHGVAKVGGREIFKLENAIGPILPMTDFIDEQSAKTQFNNIYHPGAVPDTPCSISQLNLRDYPPCRHADFDHILAWEKGKQVVAQKNVSLMAPYFADHFPLKPVLPLTILLMCKVALAYRFLAELAPMQYLNRFVLRAMRRVKMNDFVSPGSTVITTMKLKEYDEQQAIFQFISEVNGKRICVAFADFAIQESI
ncbi:MAG: hydroxymyristoyl-ACP dehydratase [Gammaproteobacteria bacterium]